MVSYHSQFLFLQWMWQDLVFLTAGWVLLLTNSRHVFPFLGHGNLLRNLGSTRSASELACVVEWEELPYTDWHRHAANQAPRLVRSHFTIGRRAGDVGDVVGARAFCLAGSFYVDCVEGVVVVFVPDVQTVLERGYQKRSEASEAALCERNSLRR